MIITAKIVAIGLGLALTAFTVSTIVLAVQKSNLNDELNEAREKMDELENALKPTTSITTPPTPTTETTPTPTTDKTQTLPTTTEITTTPEPEVINYRLPVNIYPTNYDLYIHPDIEAGSFSGQMGISVTTTETINQIVLHSHKLEIKNVYLGGGTGSATIFVKNYYLDLVREFLVVELSEEIAAGRNFILGIIYEGSMTGRIVGLYSSSYLKADNTRKVIATSKFQPTYARLAFPCFDEPAIKATFEITLVHPKGGDYHAISNMDIAAESAQGNFVEVYFTKSVPMSTYLACFIVSDFKHKTVSIDVKGIGEAFDLRVFATPEQIDKVDFALMVGKAVMEYYVDYFQIAYPLPKMDMVAIPDFVSNAMEHWGLVTYRETALLYEESTSSTANKQRIALVIAHEFAHMWFGNLVTMMWWNDLWLNEGFARYIENKGVNAVFPEWKMQDQFIVSRLHEVLTLDATLGSHPIIQTVENPDQITEIFDLISYGKGGSIIRMLEDFIGEQNFRQAVTNYLNEFKYKNAVTDDFFTEIEKLNLGIDVKAIMSTWTEQMGFPVVKVEKLSNKQYKLTQKRFFSKPDDYEDDSLHYTWFIHITYKTSASTEVQRLWFPKNQAEVLIDLPNAVDWIKFNYDQIGYYRVNYPLDMWENLSNELIKTPATFSVGDRVGLLNDVFSLADAAQLEYDVALDMTKYLETETEYVPWSFAASKLTSLKRALMFTDTFINYNKYSRALIKPIYESVTWEVGADHLRNRLRESILSAACSLGLPECLQEAEQRFTAFLAKPSERPNSDIRESVYYYGMMATGNEQTWNTMWNLFVTENDASEKLRIMYGLSAIQLPWILSNFVHLAWNEEYVRSQDYFTCLQNIAANPVGEPIVWDYVREHWPDLVERFGLNERYMGNMIPAITGRFDTETKLIEMETFFSTYPEAGAGTAARVRALETVRNNIAWLKNNKDSIGDWLKK